MKQKIAWFAGILAAKSFSTYVMCGVLSGSFKPWEWDIGYKTIAGILWVISAITSFLIIFEPEDFKR